MNHPSYDLNNKENSKIENKILADTVESIVGALYLDQGLEVRSLP